MELKTATLDDLDDINEVFKEYLQDEDLMCYVLWTKYYPFMMFKSDIAINRMFLLKEKDKIISVFVLRDENDGEPFIKWNNEMPYLYLDRFMIRYDLKGQGLGFKVLKFIEEFAKKKFNVKQLRLFVCDSNIIAMNLYHKAGYIKREGIQIRKEDKRIRLLGYDKTL